MKIKITLIVLLSVNQIFCQLYYNSKDKVYLQNDGKELAFHYENGAHISTYKKDSTHFYHWSFDRKYPMRFRLDSFLIEYNFNEVGRLVPNDSLQFIITHVDSTTDYVLPCGNADKPDWKHMYNFQFNLSYKKNVIHSGKGYSSGFRTNFSKQMRGIEWEFETYTRVWRTLSGSNYYIHTMDGFHRPPKSKDE